MAGLPRSSDMTATVDIGGSGRGVMPIATPSTTTKAVLVTASVAPEREALPPAGARARARRCAGRSRARRESGGAISVPARASGVSRSSQSATDLPQPRVVAHERLEPRARAPDERAEHVLGRQPVAQVPGSVRAMSGTMRTDAGSRDDPSIRSSLILQAPRGNLSGAPVLAHPGLHRAQRLLHVVRQLRMRQAVEEREHDALPLLRFQLLQAARQRAPLRPRPSAAPSARARRPARLRPRSRIPRPSSRSAAGAASRGSGCARCWSSR